MPLFGKKLREYLAYQIHGKRSPSPVKKPPQLARAPIPKKRAKPRKGPERSEAYKRWIRTLPCLSCGLEGKSEAAHTGTDGGMRMKASDYSCLPLCPACHTRNPDAYHSPGGKARLEARIGRACAEAAGELRGRYFSTR